MVTLVDSSVWIDYFRRPGHPGNEPLRDLVRREEVATTEPIVMELSMGPTDELTVRRIERILGSTTTLSADAELDFHAAASIYRAVRRNGRTVRSKIDCLIAAIAIRHEVPLLHKDTDFETIAAVTELQHRPLL
ncbi:PIN domain nuclease [Nocardioides carbamazepini]|uniref:type II toxin-antitoxin system VapC family toxin n=1 Tax=Nocardioides carbamazepini TaxID=2854259 RepID=UPI00214A4F49|nr:PIN domain nuclease [Nocardioides carbamazepini]MCR1781192.1 PIN domain nuclease [Nocardioides carbamazepini]